MFAEIEKKSVNNLNFIYINKVKINFLKIDTAYLFCYKLVTN